MPIALSDGVHFVYVNSRGQASVHEGRYSSSSRRGYLGFPNDPKEAGEEWLVKQGLGVESVAGIDRVEAERILDQWLKEQCEPLETENRRLREQLEPAQRVEKVRGECPFGVLLMKPTKDRDRINAQFRKLSKATHPDSGGDADVFRRLSEAKQRCLAWAGRWVPPDLRHTV